MVFARTGIPRPPAPTCNPDVRAWRAAMAVCTEALDTERRRRRLRALVAAEEAQDQGGRDKGGGGSSSDLAARLGITAYSALDDAEFSAAGGSSGGGGRGPRTESDSFGSFDERDLDPPLAAGHVEASGWSPAQQQQAPHKGAEAGRRRSARFAPGLEG